MLVLLSRNKKLKIWFTATNPLTPRVDEIFSPKSIQRAVGQEAPEI
jgi:hypothetical protein